MGLISEFFKLEGFLTKDQLGRLILGAACVTVLYLNLNGRGKVQRLSQSLG